MIELGFTPFPERIYKKNIEGKMHEIAIECHSFKIQLLHHANVDDHGGFFKSMPVVSAHSILREGQVAPNQGPVGLALFNIHE